MRGHFEWYWPVYLLALAAVGLIWVVDVAAKQDKAREQALVTECRRLGGTLSFGSNGTNCLVEMQPRG